MRCKLTFSLVIKGVICGLFLSSVLVPGCDQFDPGKNKFAITVGSRQITADELREDMEFMSTEIDLATQPMPRIKAQLIEQIIDHYLIMEYGKEKGISVSEKELQDTIRDLRKEYTEDGFKEALLKGYVEFEQWKKRLKEQCLVNKIIEKVTENVVPPDYQEITQYFEEYEDEFRLPQTLKFRQIVSRTREEAENVLDLLRRDNDMGALAREHSIAPEAENGGEVGWVALGQLDESMERVLFSMSPGDISPVIQTPYGYHIFEVMAVRPAGRRELPEVISEIETRLINKKRELFIKNWLKELRVQFKVNVNQELV